MSSFREVSPKELNDNPFKMLSEEWALVTCGSAEKFNTMTVSWGGVGVLWNKNVVTVYIRPQRYTNEFLKTNDLFTLSVLASGNREAMNYCGKYSGRDVDKAKETGLTPTELDGAISFEQSRLVLVCKKLYASSLKAESFLDKTLIEKNYPENDFHDVYIAEILKAYVGE